MDHPNQPYKRPIFAVTWDPRLPNLSDLQMKHWRSMTSQDRYLGQVFKDPPLIAYKRQINIGDFLIKAKVPTKPDTRPHRNQNGMKKCGKCVICPFILEGKHIKKDTSNWNIVTKADCNTKNLVYLIQCNISKCNQRYIGETKNSIKDRMSDHIGYARSKKLDQATGSHFNKPGHSVANMQITIFRKDEEK